MTNKDFYFSKSFYYLGDSLSKCYNCKYCRLIDENVKEVHYNILPSKINPLLRKIPVVVNLFYGDPLLQIDNTLRILKELEDDKHTGPVIIITKGDMSKFPDVFFNLDLHFAFSTFGINSNLDGSSMERFENNLQVISNFKNKYKFSIEFRPIIYKINDSPEVIENVFKIAKKYNAAIGFCGLQGTPELLKFLKQNNINLEAYPNYELGMKKALSKEVEDLIYELAEKYFVPVFRKTSCLISYVHNFERDYNAHYYRPNEMRCKRCPMSLKCHRFKSELTQSNVKQVNIPFKHEIIEKNNHVCVLYRQGICKFANNDCKNIKGKLIKIDQPITTSDVRLIKWLTGYTVDAYFTEESFISNNWLAHE